ncbi:MAG: phage holin family protein [Bacteroidales bacterium]|nr:phage holin family protein [Bacteroidales bacterium]
MSTAQQPNPQPDNRSSAGAFIARVVVMTLAIILAAWILPGVDITGGVFSAILTALVIALLNNFLRPILIFLTLPFTIVSLGLFLFVVNAIIIWLAAKLVPQFNVATFGTALVFSILITLFDYLLELPNRLLNRPKFDPNQKQEEQFTDYEEVE